MDQFTLMVIVAGIALVCGGLIGKLLSDLSNNGDNKRQLERQLEESQQELDHYKGQVTEHFTHTAELVNRLTDSYRDVHQHLANSAEVLCDTSQMTARIEQPLNRQALEDKSAVTSTSSHVDVSTFKNKNELDSLKDNASTATPPRDYADKASPEDAGTLSEGYGLKEKQADNPVADVKVSIGTPYTESDYVDSSSDIKQRDDNGEVDSINKDTAVKSGN